MYALMHVGYIETVIHRVALLICQKTMEICVICARKFSRPGISNASTLQLLPTLLQAVPRNIGHYLRTFAHAESPMGEPAYPVPPYRDTLASETVIYRAIYCPIVYEPLSRNSSSSIGSYIVLKTNYTCMNSHSPSPSLPDSFTSRFENP